MARLQDNGERPDIYPAIKSKQAIEDDNIIYLLSISQGITLLSVHVTLSVMNTAQ